MYKFLNMIRRKWNYKLVDYIMRKIFVRRLLKKIKKMEKKCFGV